VDWQNERYVRVYTRETVADSALTWEARAIWIEILKRLDRAGVLSLGGCGLRGLAGLIRIPSDVVEIHFPSLLIDGRIVQNGDFLVAPNFQEAQEAIQSNKQRTAECRARRREIALFNEKMSQNVTNSNESLQNVTTGNVLQRAVTPSLAVPSLTTLSTERVERRIMIKSAKPDPDFEAFWKAYPHRVAKKNALKAWQQAKDKPPIEEILVAIETQKNSHKWKEDGGKWIPHPATWINGGRWSDGPLLGGPPESKIAASQRVSMEAITNWLNKEEVTDEKQTNYLENTGDGIKVVPRAVPD
jgi:hypothetical protein